MTLRIIIGLVVLSFLTSCGPTAKFSYTKQDKKAPASVQFQNESEKAESYTWKFGDGNESNKDNPEHLYLLSGKYEVTLEAEKGNKLKSKTQEIYIDAPDICLVLLETEFGNMLIHLYDETPKHRDNFIKLAEQNFYDGLLFHRVIEGFMIQGGDPNSKKAGANVPLGSGGPGYRIDAEFDKSLVHIKGALAAARQGDNANPKKESSGSQFYIVDGKPLTEEQIRNFGLSKGINYTDEQIKVMLEEGGTPFLDNEYTVFGQVIEGLEVIDKIAAVKKNNRDRPLEDIEMKITVIK